MQAAPRPRRRSEDERDLLLRVGAGPEAPGLDGVAVARDDDRDTVLTLSTLLVQDGHVVSAVYSGQQVMPAIRSYQPDVCVLDIEMPGLDAENMLVTNGDRGAGLRGGALHRAGGELAYHVLEVMHAVEIASREGRHVAIESRCERPAPLDEGGR